MKTIVMVTGGCGYVGSKLVPLLVSHGFHVRVVDTQWFGNFLPESEKIAVVKKKVGELIQSDFDSVSSVIHLANIANDPSAELNPTLSWETNVLDFMHVLELSRSASIESFLYASSGSVYGIKTESRVTEELKLVPISLYNKTKMIAERVLKSYESDFRCISLRPATVCGYSPRMRLDVLINMFVWQAYSEGRIKVLGGEQIRPNIHIDDMCEVYLHFLKNQSLSSGSYNAGFENISVLEAAKMVSEIIPASIEVASTNDPRSYRQDSTKLLNTGFLPKKNVKEAIFELKERIESGSLIYDNRWYTVKTMKSLGFGSNHG